MVYVAVTMEMMSSYKTNHHQLLKQTVIQKWLRQLMMRKLSGVNQ